jgi:hypothetical protein
MLTKLFYNYLSELINPRLAISFSGGRTSAVMTKLCIEKYKDTHEIIVTFANTGCEHEDTLRFVDDCDTNWGFNVVWLEADINLDARVGVRHRQVDFITASRDGEPFEQYIKKYGIPNAGSPQCTSRLKTEVMESYLRTKGFCRRPYPNYQTAIGIRADEIDRVSAKRREYRFIYPLVDLGYTKEMVINYMRPFEWDLQIPEELGNCTWCWKKNLRKHLTLAQDHPKIFEFPSRMERLYGSHKAKNEKGRRVFFRGDRSTQEILDEAKNGEFKRFDDPYFDYGKDWSEYYDSQTGCSESCEVYPTDGR